MAEKDQRQDDDQPAVSILKPGETGMRVGVPSKYTGERSVEDSNKNLSDKIYRARNEYVKMYEENPRTWRILSFDEKFKVLIERLKKKGIIFEETEEITLRTSLRTSTVRIWTRAKEVDRHDGPNNPARVADRAARRAKRAAAAAKKNSPDSQKTA